MIKIAIVGTGGMAHSHAKTFQSIDGVSIISACDVDKNRVTAVRMSNQAMVFGEYRIWFWVGGIFCGHVLPLTVLFGAGTGFGTIVAVGALFGLFCYEYVFILAGQTVPNS